MLPGFRYSIFSLFLIKLENNISCMIYGYIYKQINCHIYKLVNSNKEIDIRKTYDFDKALFSL